MTKKKELLFSVTAKDLEFQAIKGSGPGGQNRNKVATAIRCIHPPSGAQGYSCDHNSQPRNKRIAFRRMAESKKFQDWVRMEAARRTGELAEIQRKVETQMKPENLLFEVHDEKGRWTKWEEDDERSF